MGICGHVDFGYDIRCEMKNEQKKKKLAHDRILGLAYSSDTI